MDDEPLVIEGMRTKEPRKNNRRTAKFIDGHEDDLEMRIRSHRHEVEEHWKKDNAD